MLTGFVFIGFGPDCFFPNLDLRYPLMAFWGHPVHMDDILTLLRARNTAELIQRIASDPTILDFKDASGASLLLLSTYYRNAELKQYILDHKTSFSLFEAAACGLLEVVQGQVRQDAGIVNGFAPDGFTALGLAAYLGHDNVVRFLLEHGADPSLAATNGARVAPIHAAAAAQDFGIVQRLLEHGAKVNARQHGGYTPLHAAVMHGDRPMAEILLSYGADCALQTDDGKTPRDLAKEKGHEQLLGMLLAGA